MPSFLCKTCGTQYPQSTFPPAACPICEDERQYVPAEGQHWIVYADDGGGVNRITYSTVGAAHRAEIRDESGLMGIGLQPQFAIGQRALLVESPAGNVLWDCVPLLDEMVSFVETRGGLRAIAISHPHYYTTMAEWAHRFECPILIHELDRVWVQRPDDAIEPWWGDVHELWDGLTLLRLGGHFAGGQVLHWPDGDALLSGDIVQVLPGNRWVSFMYSYPMLIPLPAREVQSIAAALEPWEFERIYGAWWGRVVREDAKRVVRRSAQRYVRALA
jgi:glyoxylase-like metal-dependent hydrolase (beta-lactamase superfamily II)